MEHTVFTHEAKLHQNIKSQDIINKVNQNKKIIGIGETGLDFDTTILKKMIKLIHLSNIYQLLKKKICHL